jgi:hypothetical protein
MKTRTCAVDLATPGLKLVLAAQVFIIVRVEIGALHHQRATVDNLLPVQKEIVLLHAELSQLPPPALMDSPSKTGLQCALSVKKSRLRKNSKVSITFA